eukprot:CAMPEP_0176497410 /NCGR_PEP_ID=MMETSP0200_2-20121128/11708_1 /TAXON_ID=947934 /ORGANISM="Chaetoceros sp., Strain GSL56" /LENGTH=404 /DNA_ID=CAMNT_0017895419 /DNA_START=93 /DNA_END=1307 /DNA_ORIENTATION=-
MKYPLAVSALLLQATQNTVAFAPSSILRVPQSLTQRSALVDPSVFTNVHQHIDSLSAAFSSINLADAADTAVTAAKDDNGWFGFLEGPIEFLLGLIHQAFVSVGMDADAWGVTIIAMTMIIKLVTYPLTKQQLESTNKMQALQPTIKEIQAKYQSNPEVMNQKIAQIYQTNEVNPLAGCVPSLLQIPIFIGLYRAVLTLAKDDKLNEPFLWLPNLEGPTYGADPAHASDWLFQGWSNGAPMLGWEDTLAFLTIPIVLVLSQSVSMNLMASKDQEQPAFLKFLPLLIGWFSLNVPAALGIYWVANNFITTALTLQIRSTFSPMTPVVPSGKGPAVDVETKMFTPAPIGEKPAGFGAVEKSSDNVKPITPMDAEIVDVEDGDASEVSSDSSKSKRGKGKKKKSKKN